VTKVLVLANETIGGEKLLNAILERSEEGVSFHVVVPQARPRHGNVVYDEVVRDSAQVRVDLAREWMRENGISSSGEVGDADPFLAAEDAIAAEGIDEVIVSTLPAESSGGCGATCPRSCGRTRGCRSSTWWSTSPARASRSA
jgi:hypothetical protein